MSATLPDAGEVRAIVREELQQALATLRAALPQPPLVTVARAAELAGVSVATMRRRIRAGEQPVVRRGRTVRVDPSSLGPPSETDIIAITHRTRHPR